MDRKQLAGFFDPKLFITDLAVGSKQELFRKLVDRLYESGSIGNKNVVLQTLLSREELGSTGLGKGVAVPHSRSLMTKDIIVMFCRVSEPIDYSAPDGEGVRLVFLILAPPQDAANRYLPLLGKLVEVVSDDAVRQQLAELQTYDEFMNLLVGE